MTWAGTGAAVGAIGSAAIGAATNKGSTDNKSESAVGKTTTSRIRPAEFDTIFNEFMGEYFGYDQSKQNELGAIQKQIDSLEAVPFGASHHNKTWKSAQLYLAPLNEIKKKLQQELLDGSGGGFKEMLGTAFDEQRGADQGLLDAMQTAYQPNTNLLGQLVDKRMAGEAVGPYGADIDKLLSESYAPSPYNSEISDLLNERTGISFGGGDPMQFITGSQQRMVGDLLRNSETDNASRSNLLSSLLTAQETGLENIQKTSLAKTLSELMPAQKAHDLFTPSNAADISYIKDLRSLFEPMEYARLDAAPSTTGGGYSTGSAGQAPGQGASNTLGILTQLLNLAGTAKDLYPSDPSSGFTDDEWNSTVNSIPRGGVST